tara:strand:- start:1086 stop:2846 length:1761 start_codon:yes stop_codon:yes gene_type:complete
MAVTLEEINAEIARREKLAEIDAEIEKRTKGRSIMSTGPEAVAGAISGLGGMVAGGLAGIAGALLPGEQGQGADWAKRTQEKLTVAPTTPEAQSLLQSVGDAGQAIDENIIRPAEGGIAGLSNVLTNPVSNVMQGFEPAKQVVRDVKEQGLPKYVGGDVLEETGSPLAATAAEMFTGAAEQLTGALVGKYTNKAINEALKTSRGRRKVIADEILSGNPNTNLVTKMVNGSGDIVTNPVAKKALKHLGGDENAIELVSMVERMNNGTKTSFNKMLDIIEDVKIHPERALDARHTDVIGKSLQDRVKDVNTINERSGKLIGKIAKAEKRNPDISAISDKFIDDLEGMGVKFSRGDDGYITPDFSRADFEGGSQKRLTIMINKLNNTGQSFEQAHKLKQSIRDNINYDVGGKDQLTQVSENLLSNLSNDINEKLRAISPVYKKANKKFADTIDTKNAFDKLLGKDININDPLAHEMLGMKAMRLDSNAITKVPIKKAINNVDKTLAKFGKKYPDDLRSLILTAGRLEDAFKTQPKGSILGRMATAVSPGAPVEAAVVGHGIGKVSELIGPNFDKKMKSIRLLSKHRKAK